MLLQSMTAATGKKIMTHKKREKIKLVKSAFIKEEEVRQQLANFVRETKFFSMGTECKKYEKAFGVGERPEAF